MLHPLRSMPRPLVCLLIWGLTLPTPSLVQAAGSEALPSAPTVPASLDSSVVLSGDQARLSALLEETLQRVEGRRRGWLRPCIAFGRLVMENIQRESQRHLELVRAGGWQSPGAEAEKRLQRYKAKARRIEAELNSLYPPLRPLLVENEDYVRIVHVLESRKQLLDALEQRTEAEEEERAQLQLLLQEKATLEERLVGFDRYRYQEGPEPNPAEAPPAPQESLFEAMGASALKASWRDELKALKLHSAQWSATTETILLDAEKLLNNLKEFLPRDLQILSFTAPGELNLPQYRPLEGPRNRVEQRLERLGVAQAMWTRQSKTVETLWREVHGIRDLAEQRLRAAPRASEAAIYTKIREEGRRGLYRKPPTDRELLAGDPASGEPAHRGPVATSLARNARIVSMMEKLNFWANQGEMGALLWLQTIQRLQHSTALLENTLGIVSPTVAARAGQQQAASLVALLSEGYTAYTVAKTQSRWASEAEAYESVRRQLTEFEARYWKAAAKLFYPSEPKEQQLQAYFRPAGELGAAGTPARAAHARFQEAWREQQALDPLPFLSQLEVDHRSDLIMRKPTAPYDELILQLLAQQPLLQEDHVRIRRGLNQLLVRPDWLRLRPQVEAILRTESPLFYLQIVKGGLSAEPNRVKFAKIVDRIQELCRTIQPPGESEPAAGVSEQPGTPAELGRDLLGAPDARREEGEGSRQEESRRRGIEETTSRAPESRPTGRAPEAARGRGI